MSNDDDTQYPITLELTVADASYLYWGLVSLEDGNSPMFLNKDVLQSVKTLRCYIDGEFNEAIDVAQEQWYLENMNHKWMRKLV